MSGNDNAAQGSAVGCWPFAWRSTYDAAAAQAKKDIALVLSQGGSLKIGPGEVKPLDTAIQQRHGTTSIIPLITSDINKAGTEVALGVNLLTCLDGDLQAFIGFLNTMAPLLDLGLNAQEKQQLSEVINFLTIADKKVQGLIRIGGMLKQGTQTLTDGTALINDANNGNQTLVRKDAAAVITDIKNLIKALNAGGMIQPKIADMINQGLDKAFNLVSTGANKQQMLLRPITVKVATRPTAAPATQSISMQNTDLQAPPAAATTSGCMPTLRAPIVLQRTVHALETKVEQEVQYIQAQGGPVKLVMNQINSIEQNISRYAVKLAPIIQSDINKAGPEVQEGITLMTGLQADITVLIPELTADMPFVSATFPQATVALSALIAFFNEANGMLTFTISASKVGLSLLTTTSALTSSVPTANAGTTQKNLVDLISEMKDAITAASAGGMIPAKYAAMFSAQLDQAYIIKSQVADKQGKMKAPITVYKAAPPAAASRATAQSALMRV